MDEPSLIPLSEKVSLSPVKDPQPQSQEGHTKKRQEDLLLEATKQPHCSSIIEDSTVAKPEDNRIPVGTPCQPDPDQNTQLLISHPSSLMISARDEERKIVLKPFFSGETGGWWKTHILRERECQCCGLAATPTHIVVVLGEKSKEENSIAYFNTHVAFSSAPSNGHWTLNTIEREKDSFPGRNAIAVGNGFCVIAGHEDNKSVRVFISPSSFTGWRMEREDPLRRSKEWLSM